MTVFWRESPLDVLSSSGFEGLHVGLGEGVTVFVVREGGVFF